MLPVDASPTLFSYSRRHLVLWRELRTINRQKLRGGGEVPKGGKGERGDMWWGLRVSLPIATCSLFFFSADGVDPSSPFRNKSKGYITTTARCSLLQATYYLTVVCTGEAVLATYKKAIT